MKTSIGKQVAVNAAMMLGTALGIVMIRYGDLGGEWTLGFSVVVVLTIGVYNLKCLSKKA